MKKRIFAVALLFGVAGIVAFGAEKDARLYELRTYFAAPGKLEELHARFRNYTAKLCEKHGMFNIGYWVPVENPDNALIYILAYPSPDARERSWKAFQADPEWVAIQEASERNGKLVARLSTMYLQVTDYSPEIKPANAGKQRVFELRSYTAASGKLAPLNARFRDHTVGLLEKHRITNVGYWNLSKVQPRLVSSPPTITPSPLVTLLFALQGPGMSNKELIDKTLVYIVAHESKEAAEKSYSEFRSDPEWISVQKESERKGALIVQGGVKSLFMVATDYSPIK